MTIDKLAIAIQKDFNNIHEEMADLRGDIKDIRGEMAGMRDTMSGMATKEELQSVKSEILLAINELRETTQGISNKLTAYAERTNEIDIRLRVVEKRG